MSCTGMANGSGGHTTEPEGRGQVSQRATESQRTRHQGVMTGGAPPSGGGQSRPAGDPLRPGEPVCIPPTAAGRGAMFPPKAQLLRTPLQHPEQGRTNSLAPRGRVTRTQKMNPHNNRGSSCREVPPGTLIRARPLGRLPHPSTPAAGEGAWDSAHKAGAAVESGCSGARALGGGRRARGDGGGRAQQVCSLWPWPFGGSGGLGGWRGRS